MTSGAQILVEGRVQGVGYRAFVERRAARLGLVGYVMNLPDGRVRVHVEGDRGSIESLLAELAAGPRQARVERTDVRWLTPSGAFTGFTVRHGEAGE
jgi:acylphosphatase